MQHVGSWMPQPAGAHLVEWIAAFGSVLAAVATGFAVRTAQRAGAIAERLADLELKPHMLVELVDGELFRINGCGKVYKKIGDEKEARPLMLRLVNAGRTSATCTKLCRVIDIVSVEKGKNGVPRGIDVSTLKNGNQDYEPGRYIWCKETTFAAAAGSKSASISTGLSTAVLQKIKGPAFGPDTWVYVHGFIEFENEESGRRGRTGFYFLFIPEHEHLGFFVSLDDENSWYYKELPTKNLPHKQLERLPC